MDVGISASTIAKLHGFNPSYIRAEIKAGRLKAEKIGRDWFVDKEEYKRWIANPRRKSRSKDRETAS